MVAKKKARTTSRNKKPVTPQAAPRIVRTLGEVAAHFGRSLGTVRKDWRPCWPKTCGKAGAWNLAAIAKWRAEQQPESEDDTDYRDWLRRRKIAEARIKEADADRRERMNRLADEEICFRADVEEFLSEFFRMTRDLHGRLAVEMAAEFPATVRTDLVRSLEDRLRQLLRSLRTQAERLREIVDSEN
jgi:phage terminase Nu1 subunit (DNA packaging protein)